LTLREADTALRAVSLLIADDYAGAIYRVTYQR
jgi:hypothetical protein